MQGVKKAGKCLCVLLLFGCLFLLGGIVWLDRTLPDTFLVVQGEPLRLGEYMQVSQSSARRDGEQTVTLRWMGLFPVKTATVRAVERPVVLLGGMPFGIKLYTDGVLVVGLSDVDGENGRVNPARAAGLRVNDRILSVDGTPVSTAVQLSAAVLRSGGNLLTLRVVRDGVAFTVRFTPVRSRSDNGWKAGIWVRDSAAGIGTVTFFDPSCGAFAGLGHAICDTDTGKLLPIRSGEAVPARIYGTVKSEVGAPGELCGGFEPGSLGTISHNCDVGLYGIATRLPTACETVEVAMKQEVTEGEAWLYTTVDGTTPRRYRVRITQVRRNDASMTKSMIVEVTDKALLAQTGGIVQGMSGSPIVQNGKLIAAVTHVFVGDPTRGYAVFAENMLKTAQSVRADALNNAA